MTSLTSLSLTLLLGVLGGCGTGHIDGPIDYTVTGGLDGNGDGTALHVAPDGTATRLNLDGTTETAVLPPATLHDLHSKIADAQFPSLEPLYGDTCCDLFIYQVGVQLDGAAHFVEVSQLAHAPGRLQAVVATLRKIHSLPLHWR